MEVTRENVVALRDRIKLGNDKLYGALKQMTESECTEEELNQFYQRWQEKYKDLEKLCDQLIAMGFQNCLYITEGKKMRKCLHNDYDPKLWCIVCPCKNLPPEDQPCYEEISEIFDKPRKCYSCKGTHFYLNPGRVWTCATCHPPPKTERADS